MPALLVVFFYKRLHEPVRWTSKQQELRGWTVFRPLQAVFSPKYRRRTIFNSIYLLVSTIGLWGGSVYVPAAITYLAAKAGRTELSGARLASYGAALLSICPNFWGLVV